MMGLEAEISRINFARSVPLALAPSKAKNLCLMKYVSMRAFEKITSQIGHLYAWYGLYRAYCIMAFYSFLMCFYFFSYILTMLFLLCVTI
jgi:hypothetical protein